MNGNEQPNDYKQTEKLTEIDPSALYALIHDIVYDDAHKRYDWKIVKSKLTSSDKEDGGGYYDCILQHITTGRFYETKYCDWDMENTKFDEELGKVIMDSEGGRCDLNCVLAEVEPQQVTICVARTFLPVTSYRYI